MNPYREMGRAVFIPVEHAGGTAFIRADLVRSIIPVSFSPRVDGCQVYFVTDSYMEVRETPKVVVDRIQQALMPGGSRIPYLRSQPEEGVDTDEGELNR
ncbi:hypothetical protein DRQ25_05255 [Candidatus Fermentibacteria bacterium]|nr:MAG: hypothetical protein DRQ25_05255 [Candidatus Fermentibacteria bacterium]